MALCASKSTWTWLAGRTAAIVQSARRPELGSRSSSLTNCVCCQAKMHKRGTNGHRQGDLGPSFITGSAAPVASEPTPRVRPISWGESFTHYPWRPLTASTRTNLRPRRFGSLMAATISLIKHPQIHGFSSVRDTQRCALLSILRIDSALRKVRANLIVRTHQP